MWLPEDGRRGQSPRVRYGGRSGVSGGDEGHGGGAGSQVHFWTGLDDARSHRPTITGGHQCLVPEPSGLLRRHIDVSAEAIIGHEELPTSPVFHVAQPKPVRVHNPLLKLQLQAPRCQEVRRPSSEWSLQINTEDQYHQDGGSGGHGISEAAHQQDTTTVDGPEWHSERPSVGSSAANNPGRTPCLHRIQTGTRIVTGVSGAADQQSGNHFDTSNAISTGEDLGEDFGGNAATAGKISVSVIGGNAERSTRHGCQAGRVEHWKLRQVPDHQSGESDVPSGSCEAWFMSDAERRSVTIQARRCMSDSWEECDEALKF